MGKDLIVFDGEFYDASGKESSIKSSGSIDRENFEWAENVIYSVWLAALLLIVVGAFYFYWN